MISSMFWSMRTALVALGSLCLLIPTLAPAANEADSIPDPSTVTVPDIGTTDPKVLANGYKFFVFHNPSVDFATAYADIAECRSFLPAGTGRILPSFTPWIAAAPPEPTQAGINRYGLVGAAIGAIIAPKFTRGENNTVLRRCMETRGYVRYAVSETIWNALNDPKNPMMVAMQARLATGPKPPQPEVIDR
jgi:hypothetical protein